ncbi:thiamine-phosphate kinase [Kitasatospora purpeofusca]|uniref:thiamine-phosphate kinase n=1 Tax=Kitasatospora purpeofusca TaxID=67352 RepID=UPI0037F38C54
MPGHSGTDLPAEIVGHCDDLLLAVPYAGTICVDPSTMEIIGHLETDPVDGPDPAGLGRLVGPVTTNLGGLTVDGTAVRYNCTVAGREVPVSWYPQSRVVGFAAGGPAGEPHDEREAGRYRRMVVVSSRSREVSWALRDIRNAGEGNGRALTGALDPDAAPTWLTELFPAAAGVLAGVGADDCGIVRTEAGCLVVTTDFINARPICLELGLADRRALGRLVVGHNLSDLCGSGAAPTALLIGVMAEHGAGTEEMRLVMEGVREAAGRFGVPVIGGDTKLGKAWTIFGVAIGSAPDEDALFIKSRARAGEDVWVSGPVGDCCGSLLAVLDTPDDPAVRAWATTAIADPVPPVGRSAAVAALRLVRAGTDLSDGLAADLGDLCRSSGVGAELDAELIPVSDRVRSYAERRETPPWAFGLVLGGDLQFIVTAPPSAREALAGCGMTRIGRTVPEPGLTLRCGDRVEPLAELGHNDARGLPFSAEARYLVDQVRELGFTAVRQ